MRECSGDYGEIYKRNGGRLFVADCCKSGAIKEIAGIFKSGGYKSAVIITGDALTAKQLNGAFSGEFTVFDSFEGFKACLAESGTETLSESKLLGAVQGFKAKYPKIIIAAKEEGEPLLHRPLCRRTSINGIYSTVKTHAHFCISDFIAECRYEFAAADGIYGLIPYARKAANGDKSGAELSPLDYDSADFLGTRYYFHRDNSYKRLKNILTGAKGCVLLSDVIFNEEAAELYFALSLLHDEFNFFKSRDFVKQIQNTYSEESATLSADLTYALDDNGIVSACMRLLKGRTQTVPSSVSSMREYLKASIEYLSQEELFVKAVHGYLAGKSGSITINRLIEKLADSSEESARCLCNMFFGDPLKAELEGILKNPVAARMQPEEISGLMSIFRKYGLYCNYSFEKSRFDIMRIIRDDSGYEEMIRRSYPQKQANGDDICFSASGNGSRLLNKCAATAYLLGGEQKLKYAPPVTVVTDGDFGEIREIFKNILSGFTFESGLDALASKQGKTLTFITPEELRASALPVSGGTVVFFDFLPDVPLMRILVNKALASGGANAVLLADYGGISGNLADFWQWGLLSVDKAYPPVGISEVPVKDNSAVRNYRDVVKKLDGVYKSISVLASCGTGAEQTASEFCGVVNEFSLQPPLENEIKDNFSFVTATGKSYESVFAHSMSVGGSEKVVEEIITRSTDKSGKKSFERVYVEQKDEVIFFNTCAKRLRRTCDIYENNCGGCDEFRKKKLRRNDLKTFVNSVKSFYAEAAGFYEKQKNTGNNGIIWSGKDKDFDKIIDGINAASKKAEVYLNKLLQTEKEHNGSFYVPYQVVNSVRVPVVELYSGAMKKHYSELTDIFIKASEELSTSLKTVGAGFAAIKD